MLVQCFECVPLSGNIQATLQQTLQEAQNSCIHQGSHCNNLQRLTVGAREMDREMVLSKNQKDQIQPFPLLIQARQYLQRLMKNQLTSMLSGIPSCWTARTAPCQCAPEETMCHISCITRKDTKALGTENRDWEEIPGLEGGYSKVCPM